ncbi:MAG: LysM peptidoglycan-binding domain-containing protein [Opitutales bacterium]
MKYKGIFGIVVLIHIGMGLFIVTQPGCQTSQEAETPAPSPVIGPVDESELEAMNAEPVAPVADPEDDLFKPLDQSFNSGAPEPVYVDIPSSGAVDSASSAERSSPLRPAEPISAQPIGVLEYAPPSVEPVSEDDTITIVSDTPVSETYAVSAGDSLWAISKKFGVSVSSIREENALKSDSLQIGQILIIPGKTREISVATPSRELIAPSVSQDIEAREYVVVPRDTLSGIAQKTGVSVAAIRSVNNLRSDLIKVGDILILPAESEVVQPEPRPAGPVSRAPRQVEAPGVYHVVESGENPTVIARKYGITVKELMAKNGNFDPRSLRVGQRLLVGDLVEEAQQSVEVEAPASQPQTPAGFQPVTSSQQDSIDVDIPAQAPVTEPEFDEEQFIREIEGAPVVSPVPVDQ